MNDAKSKVAKLCDEAIRRIDETLSSSGGRPIDPSESLLKQVRNELRAMRDALDPATFKPGYGRALLDWPATNDLIDFLIEVKYKYDRLPTSHR